MKEKLQSFWHLTVYAIEQNLTAFLAWGLLCALSVGLSCTGQLQMNSVLKPILNFGLPVLLGWSCGCLQAGPEGGIAGAFSASAIAASCHSSFLPLVILAGSIAGWYIQKIQQLFSFRFERDSHKPLKAIVLALSLALLWAAFYTLGRPVYVMTLNGISELAKTAAKGGADCMQAILAEPAKLLLFDSPAALEPFTQMGAQDAVLFGKSVLYFMVLNPGPGLGILMACWLSGRKSCRSSAWFAALIHFFCGIPGVCFPYVFLNPCTLGALILAGTAGTAICSIMQGGLSTIPGSASVFALFQAAGPETKAAAAVSLTVSALVSFGAACSLMQTATKLRRENAAKQEAKDLLEVLKEEQEEEFPVLVCSQPEQALNIPQSTIQPQDPAFSIVCTCSRHPKSARTAASILNSKLQEASVPLQVSACSLEDCSPAANVIITCSEDRQEVRSKCCRAVILVEDHLEEEAGFEPIAAEIQRFWEYMQPQQKAGEEEKIIYIACSEGTAASVIAAGSLQARIREKGCPLKVLHSSISKLPAESRFVITHKSKEEQTARQCPQARIFTITNFIGTEEFDHILAELS